MGGLWKKMPHTTFTFLIAALALAGIPPLSGFWSKDEILAAAYESGNPIFYYGLTATAAVTAFYMFRLVFLAFFGKPRTELHVHESPAVMTVPLWLLAIGSAVMGLPGSPWMDHAFQNFIQPHALGQGGEHTLNPLVMTTSVACGGGGILLAAIIYLVFPRLAGFFGKIFRPVYLASSRKLWFDELYQTTVIRAWYGLGRGLNLFDQQVVDGAVNGVGIGTLRVSDLKNWIDIHIVDGIVNGVGALTRGFSAALRKIQTGLIQNYLFILFVGVLIMLFFEQR
jgi:NADH-quinone oxidoreductase subunit L